MSLLLSILIASSSGLAAEERVTEALGRAMNEHLTAIEKLDTRIAMATDETERRQLQDQRRSALLHARQAIAAQRIDAVDYWLELLERFEVTPAAGGDPVTPAGTITHYGDCDSRRRTQRLLRRTSGVHRRNLERTTHGAGDLLRQGRIVLPAEG